MRNEEEFKKDLEKLINKHSLENENNTPDFILSEHLVSCLKNFSTTVNSREKWYGRPASFSEGKPLEIGKETGWAPESKV